MVNRQIDAHRCASMRYESVSIHDKSDVHAKCVELTDAKKARPGESSAEKIVMSLNKNIVSKLDILFRNAHAIAYNNRSFLDFDWMCALDMAKGLDIGKTYTNRASGLDFAHSIADVERSKLKTELELSPFFLF